MRLYAVNQDSGQLLGFGITVLIFVRKNLRESDSENLKFSEKSDHPGPSIYIIHIIHNSIHGLPHPYSLAPTFTLLDCLTARRLCSIGIDVIVYQSRRT